MNKTKQKILVQSLKLFNESGVSNVSLRNIADAEGISVGNLQYHFKKREDIIEALYFEIVEKIDAIFITEKENLFQTFLNITNEMITILYEYHFFLLDFINITRGNQKIKKHYSDLSKRRESEFLKVAEVFIQSGLFRKELLKNEYHNLYKRTEVISNFWFSSTLIQTTVLSSESIKEYSFLIAQSIYPYLTEEGKKQYANIYPDHLTF